MAVNGFFNIKHKMTMGNHNGKRPTYRKPNFEKQDQSPGLVKKYYDNADMMQLFNVSGRTLQRWRDKGIVPYKRLGGKIYYLSQKVDELMAGNDGQDESYLG